MGRHAASGSDGLGQGNASATAGRRRTDAPDGAWPGAAAQLSDHPTAPGRERSGRRRDVLLDAPAGDGARQVSRPRLPLPPVPVGARSAAPAAPRPAAAPAVAPGPRTSAAPFRAVPHPEPREEIAARARGADVLAQVSAGDALSGAPARATGRPASSVLVDDEPLVTTGPSGGPGGRTPAPRVPRVPRQTAPSGAPSSSYGDWTKPSRSEDTGRSSLAADAAVDVLGTPVAPATTAIPERGATTRRDEAPEFEDGLDTGYDDLHVDDRAADDTLHGTGPVKGGRAAYRAERQAADAARRKAAKRNGTPEVLFDDDEPERKPRRVLTGLVAMAVVAGAVLGVYQVVAPTPEEGATQPATAPVSTPTVASPSAALPPLTLEPVPVEPAVTTPVRVPVTVLNATSVTGLAGKISGAVVAGGWESPGVGAYPGTDVAATTVFFTEGDEQQRQAALQLIDQFPDLVGPAPRFFEVTDVPAPGLVVVATGDWQP